MRISASEIYVLIYVCGHEVGALLRRLCLGFAGSSRQRVENNQELFDVVGSSPDGNRFGNWFPFPAVAGNDRKVSVWRFLVKDLVPISFFSIIFFPFNFFPIQ